MPPPDIRDPGASRPASEPQALLLDLDGTCLDQQVRLHPRIRSAVRAASARLPVIIATGRMYRSTLPWAYELGVHAPLVCYQGALARTMPNGTGAPMGELLLEVPLDTEPARHALHLARRNDWHFQVYQDDELICERDRPEAQLYSRIAGLPFRVVPDLDPLLERGTTKAACVIEDPAEVDRCVAAMSREVSGARITRSLPQFVEIVNPKVSKAAACEVVCAWLGVSVQDAVAIGDAPNDLEMLDAAGFGIAVSTARAEVLAVADATCAPPEQGGVADALEALGLA